MHNLNAAVTETLTRLGAELVGFGELAELPPEVRHGLPVGISFGISVPRDIIRGISEAPTPEFWDYYHSGQDELEKLAEAGAEYLRSLGYRAVALTKDAIKFTAPLRSELPLKTIATRARLGWIGKCALLATEEFGTGIWFGGILTDAPLITAEPINESRCGDCTVCTNACPGGAASGRLWHVGIDREDFFDAQKCAAAGRERAKQYLGIDYPLCGRCIAVCPKTRRHVERGE
ncbi:MAG: epoxyqueuosine reductase, partial [Oscillospiraceae bacterium]|jgi:epoxyqueuosine reductase QueG|nr:epoxyqueuosine reductase [Oscillospiraceae bacterium]